MQPCSQWSTTTLCLKKVQMAVTLPPPSFTVNLITSILFSTTSPSAKPKCEIICLQQIQNYLACAVVKAPKSCHITPILHSHSPFTRYNRLSNRFDNLCDKRVERTATVRSTGCQTGLYNRFDNWLNVCIHDTTGCQGGLTTSLTTGYIAYTNI